MRLLFYRLEFLGSPLVSVIISIFQRGNGRPAD